MTTCDTNRIRDGYRLTKNMTRAALVGAMMLTAPVLAWATPVGTLAFTTPTGTVGSHDVIGVDLTLTLAAGSDPLVADAFQQLPVVPTWAEILPYLFGHVLPAFPDADNDTVPDALDPTSFTANVNVFYECSGTFAAVCTTGPPYDFNFSSVPAPMAVMAGGSLTWQFGTFAPTGGTAPAGTYSFENAGIFIQVFDQSLLDPRQLYPGQVLHLADIPIASIRDSGGAFFTRTVLADPPVGAAVPEPASLVLFGTGLVGLTWLRRRKRA